MAHSLASPALVVGLVLAAHQAVAAQTPSPAAAPACDSAAFRTPVATVVDTLRLRMRPSATLPTLPQPWADFILEDVGSRIAVPRPLSVAAYDEAQPAAPSTAPFEVEPSLYAEARVTVRRDGRIVGVDLVARSMADAIDEALLHAVRAADSTHLLPPMPANAPEQSTVFLALTRGTLPEALRELRALPARDVALLSIPRYRNAEPIRPMPGMGGPTYPRPDRDARRPGKVLVQFVVDEQGAVASGTTTLVSFSAASFATSVIDFLPKAHFQPATIAGCPVRQLVQQPFEFRLFPGAPPGP